MEKQNDFELIIFDMDGTLIDPRIDVANALNVTLIQLDLAPLSYKEIFGLIRDGMRDLMERVLPPSHQDRIETAITLYRSHYDNHLLDNTTLYPSVRETLEELASLKKAVVSNKREKPVRAILKGFNLPHHFEMVLGGDSIGERKPAPHAILKVLDYFDVSLSNALIVGDSPEDIQAGHAAGIRTCGVTYGYRSRESLVDEKPDYLIDDLRLLLEIVEGIRA
jgi:phosphoglycolate phosphatase